MRRSARLAAVKAKAEVHDDELDVEDGDQQVTRRKRRSKVAADDDDDEYGNDSESESEKEKRSRKGKWKVDDEMGKRKRKGKSKVEYRKDSESECEEEQHQMKRKRKSKVNDNDSEVGKSNDVEIVFSGEAPGRSADVTDNQQIEAVSPRQRLQYLQLETARNRAAFYAHYSDGDPLAQPYRGRRRQQEEEEWPGPVATGMSLMQGRAAALAARKKPEDYLTPKIVDWTPRNSQQPHHQEEERCPPSLESMCIELLCQNVEYVESLEGVDESIKRRMILRLYELSRITPKVARLVMTGPVTQLSLPDCTQIKDEDFMEIAQQCPLDQTEILELGFCGRMISDGCIDALKLPHLRKLHLRGNFRLTDQGMLRFVQTAPELLDVRLHECSEITEISIEAIANYAGPRLQILSLEGCSSVSGLKSLPYLLKLSGLRVLSLANVSDVTDEILSELMVALGPKLEELNVSSCSIEDAGIAAIGACGSGLRTLHLNGLQLTDTALASLSEGCKSLRDVSFDHCLFSDEALAEFFAASGASLRKVSIRSVKEAGDKSLVALAKHANRTLEALNASFCRKMTDEGFGHLADSCFSLVELQLFGCTQVTNKFVNGHSNKSLKLIGLWNKSLTFEL